METYENIEDREPIFPVPNSEDSPENRDELECRNAAAFKQKVNDVLKVVTKKGGAFFVTGKFRRPPIIVIDIKEAGKLHFPVYELGSDIIEKFEQSPFEQLTESAVDVSAKNPKHLSPDLFQILYSEWDNFLKTKILTTIANKMEIETAFEATLHQLLLFEPGSFFQPHRDAEKEKGTFATLFIQLPSKFTGGELVTNYGKKSRRFDFSSGNTDSGKEFSMFYAAFYSDCEREILPVTEGYRVCLIYNLVSKTVDTIPILPQPSECNALLCEIMKTWAEDGPSKLVYVLANKYTKSNLTFKNLQGTDRTVAAVINDSAELGSVKVFLALLTKQVFGETEGENVTCHSEEYLAHELTTPVTRESTFSDELFGEEELEDKFSEVSYEIFHPVTKYSLNNFVSPNGKSYDFGELVVSLNQEVIPENCFDDNRVTFSEYQEYNGNESATASNWYRRAAVVFWPEDKTLEMLQAASACEGTIEELFLETIARYSIHPDESEGSRKVTKWALSLVNAVERPRGFQDLEQCLEVFSAIISTNSLSLLKRFLHKYCLLNSSAAPLLLTQCDKYGWEELGLQLLDIFTLRNRIDSAEMLLTLVPEASSSEEKSRVLSKCLKEVLQPPSDSLWWTCQSPFSFEDEKKIFHAIFLVSRKIRFDLLQYILKRKKTLILEVVAPVLIELASIEGITTEHCWISAKNHCISVLESFALVKIEIPDWCRTEKIDCSCQDCQKLVCFLESDKEKEEFKIGKERRTHIQHQLKNLKDISHETKQTGIPHTLVVVKNCESIHILRKEQERAKVLLHDLHKLQNPAFYLHPSV